MDDRNFLGNYISTIFLQDVFVEARPSIGPSSHLL